MPQRFCIEIDDREAGNAVAEALRRMPQVDLDIRRLDVGDYLVDDVLLFERKTLLDLVESIKDGRLFAQALRLTQARQRPALILEGRTDLLAGSQMRREAIQGALITLTLYFQIPLLRATDADETARLILTAARQGRARTSGALPRPGQRPRGKQRIQSHILQGLPGVGPERARRLLDRFGSIEAVVAAPAEELIRVPGIGRGTADLIRWSVEEPRAHYAAAAGIPGARA